MFFRPILLVFFITCISFSIKASENEPRDKTGGIEKRFTMMDRNGDGKLSQDEFKRPEMLQKLDKNKDGYVTLEEAKQNFEERPAFNFEERLKMLDTNNDGKLSREEFKKPELFDRLDLNKDGFVTLEEANSKAKKKPDSEDSGGQ